LRINLLKIGFTLLFNIFFKAAISDYHFQVSKKFIQIDINGTKSDRPILKVELLDPSYRKQELANLAGGVMVNSKLNSKKKDANSDSTIVFAKSLLSQAQALKQELEEIRS
jgi:DNA repair ATPase RecN